MKKAVITAFILFFAGCFFAFGQNDKNISFNYGLEVNSYSPEGSLAGAAVLGFDINLPWLFAAGINLTACTDVEGNNAIEPTLLVRRYFFGQYTGFFVQVDFGIVIITAFEETTIMYTGGVRCGYRFLFGNVFHVEPYIRAGYPFLAGVGVILGLRY